MAKTSLDKLSNLLNYKKNLKKLDDGLFQLIQNKKDINTTKEGLIE